jgi:hypothetical protein
LENNYAIDSATNVVVLEFSASSDHTPPISLIAGGPDNTGLTTNITLRFNQDIKWQSNTAVDANIVLVSKEKFGFMQFVEETGADPEQVDAAS